MTPEQMSCCNVVLPLLNNVIEAVSGTSNSDELHLKTAKLAKAVSVLYRTDMMPVQVLLILFGAGYREDTRPSNVRDVVHRVSGNGHRR